MKKTLIVAVVLAVLTVLLTQASVQYWVHTALAEIEDRHQADFALDVSWVSAGFDGTLHLHDVAFTPYALKRTFHAEQLTLVFDSYADLLTELPGVMQGRWHAIQRVRSSGGYTELEGRSVDEWLAQQSHNMVNGLLQVAACPPAEEQDLGAFYAALGLSQLGFDVDIALHRDASAARTNLSMGLDLAERGALDFYATLSDSALAGNLGDIQWAQLAFHSLQIAYVENGFLRRISNYCTGDNGWTREAFALAAAQQWQADLAASGLLVNDRLASAYAGFLQLGGRLSVAMQQEQAIRLRAWEDYFDRDLSDAVNLQVRLNDLVLEGADARLLSAVLAPAPELAPVAPPPAVVEMPKSFKPVALDTFSAEAGSRVRVRLNDGKTVEGRLETADERAIVVSQALQGGRVAYNLQRDEIASIAIWQ